MVYEKTGATELFVSYSKEVKSTPKVSILLTFRFAFYTVRFRSIFQSLNYTEIDIMARC